MFTGIIAEIGTVAGVQRGVVTKIEVASEVVRHGVKIGDSVAVNGVCLTVTKPPDRVLSFDAVQETLDRSALGALRVGEKVNLEAALRAGDPLGGHFVLGHVDGIGSIESVTPIGDSRVIRVNSPQNVLKYIVEKGSIALDGISLTVASYDSSGFTIAVIPHTIAATTLRDSRAGDRVNLEADVLGKYVEKLLGRSGGSGGSLESLLRESGFV